MTDQVGLISHGGRRARSRLAVVVIGAVLVAITGCISSANVSGNVLSIVGGSGADNLVLRLKSGDPNTLEVDDGNDGTVEYSFDRTTFTSIVVDGGGGDDVITISQVNGLFTDTEATTLRGVEGKDQLIGGSGAETLDGGPGADVLDGNSGNDVLIGGDDADQFSWAPGKGSDTIDGGLGADRLAFTGANINESFALTNVGGHVRLTRDIAAVTMDIDGVESVDLALLGGTDVATVNNLAGTDLTTFTPDLAGSGGVDDGSVDEVRVPASTVIGRSGAAATVTGSGVGAQVRALNGSLVDRLVVIGATATDQVLVTGTASPDVVTATASGADVVLAGMTPGLSVALTSVEQLGVDLGAGNDQFSTSGSFTLLTTLTVAGGSGRDTILGGTGADTINGGPGADTLDGNQGSDTVLGGDDDDIITWDPGDSSDTIDGGAGSDQLVFNGANLNEVIDISNVGGHARLTRNIAAVVLDLVGIDSADVNLLGGTDTIAVHDLTGTGLGYVGANLAATPGGVADGFADQVAVDGTAGNDAVDVVAVGSAVEVAGLPSVVRTTGADPTLDTLTVNGLAGTDTITSSPAAAALILLSLLP